MSLYRFQGHKKSLPSISQRVTTAPCESNSTYNEYTPAPGKSQGQTAGKGENGMSPLIINTANLILQIALIAIIIRNGRKK